MHHLHLGYSLLEMLVVLVIVGLISGIALPALSVAYESWQWRTMQDEVINEISELPLRALREGRTFHLPSDKVLNLPENLRISFEPELVVNARGVCKGANMTISYLSRQRTIQLLPPLCRIGE